LIRDGADSCSVSLDVVVEGQPLTITRSKGRGRDATLSLAVDGQPLKVGLGTAATGPETRAEVRRRIGIGYDALLAGPFALQRTRNLMDEQPKDRKDLLIDLLLDQEQYPEWVEAAKAHVASAKAIIDSNATQLAHLSTADLPALREAAAARLAAAAEVIREGELSLLKATTEADEAVTALADAKARAYRATVVEAQLADARKEFLAAKVKHTDALAGVTAAQATLTLVTTSPFAIVSEDQVTASAEDAATARAQHLALKDQKSHAQALLDAAGQSKPVTCPNCGEVFQPGVDAVAVEQAQADLAMVESLLGEAQKRAIEAASVASKARSGRSDWLDWDRRHSDARTSLERAQSAVAEALAALTPLAERGRALKAENDALEAEAGKLSAAEVELAAAKASRDRIVGRLQEAKSDFASESLERMSFDRDIETHTRLLSETEAARKDASIFSVVRDAFSRDGIPTMKLEAALPVIEDHANGVLARMPGNFSLRLLTQKATAKGTATDTLDVVVDPGTGSPRNYAMLSGGQQFRVDLALRMGITSVLSDRHIDTLVLDESFDRWQDDAGRNAVLDTLASIADDFTRILVVSHHPDVIERLERMGAHRIEVTQNSEGVASASIAA
jgi:DNA repair exonuclease SbcCD ATPase subunit